MPEQTRKRGTGLGLAKGLSVTLKTMLQPAVRRPTFQFRGYDRLVIALSGGA